MPIESCLSPNLADESSVGRPMRQSDEDFQSASSQILHPSGSMEDVDIHATGSVMPSASMLQPKPDPWQKLSDDAYGYISSSSSSTSSTLSSSIYKGKQRACTPLGMQRKSKVASQSVKWELGDDEIEVIQNNRKLFKEVHFQVSETMAARNAVHKAVRVAFDNLGSGKAKVDKELVQNFSELTEAVKYLQNKLYDLSRTISLLTSRNALLNENYRLLKEKEFAFARSAAKKAEQNESLRFELEELRQQLDELESLPGGLSGLYARIDDAFDLVELSEQRVEKAQFHEAQVMLALGDAREQLVLHKAKNLRLMKENEDLRREIGDLQKKNEDSQQELRSARDEAPQYSAPGLSVSEHEYRERLYRSGRLITRTAALMCQAIPEVKMPVECSQGVTDAPNLYSRHFEKHYANEILPRFLSMFEYYRSQANLNQMKAVSEGNNGLLDQTERLMTSITRTNTAFDDYADNIHAMASSLQSEALKLKDHSGFDRLEQRELERDPLRVLANLMTFFQSRNVADKTEDIDIPQAAVTQAAVTNVRIPSHIREESFKNDKASKLPQQALSMQFDGTADDVCQPYTSNTEIDMNSFRPQFDQVQDTLKLFNLQEQSGYDRQGVSDLLRSSLDESSASEDRPNFSMQPDSAYSEDEGDKSDDEESKFSFDGRAHRPAADLSASLEVQAEFSSPDDADSDDLDLRGLRAPPSSQRSSEASNTFQVPDGSSDGSADELHPSSDHSCIGRVHLRHPDEATSNISALQSDGSAHQEVKPSSNSTLQANRTTHDEDTPRGSGMSQSTRSLAVNDSCTETQRLDRPRMYAKNWVPARTFLIKQSPLAITHPRWEETIAQTLSNEMRQAMEGTSSSSESDLGIEGYQSAGEGRSSAGPLLAMEDKNMRAAANGKMSSRAAWWQGYADEDPEIVQALLERRRHFPEYSYQADEYPACKEAKVPPERTMTCQTPQGKSPTQGHSMTKSETSHAVGHGVEGDGLGKETDTKEMSQGCQESLDIDEVSTDEDEGFGSSMCRI